jgi:hypothetical protein
MSATKSIQCPECAGDHAVNASDELGRNLREAHALLAVAFGACADGSIDDLIEGSDLTTFLSVVTTKVGAAQRAWNALQGADG